MRLRTQVVMAAITGPQYVPPGPVAPEYSAGLSRRRTFRSASLRCRLSFLCKTPLTAALRASSQTRGLPPADWRHQPQSPRRPGRPQGRQHEPADDGRPGGSQISGQDREINRTAHPARQRTLPRSGTGPGEPAALRGAELVAGGSYRREASSRSMPMTLATWSRSLSQASKVTWCLRATAAIMQSTIPRGVIPD